MEFYKIKKTRKGEKMKEEIKKQLKQLSDQKYKEFHGNLCPGTDNIIGIRVPILRNYAKELVKKYSIEELLKNIDNEYYEEIMLQGMIIGLDKKANIETILEYMKEFIPKIDNWAICDVFCAGLKITNKYPKEIWSFISKYLESDEEFELRFAIVMILDYYINEQYIDKVLKVLDSVHIDKYYVQMAVAWAISICLIKFYDRTIRYLQSENCHLDKFTYNKSIQKAIESYRITDEQKVSLRSLKKNYD